MSERKRLYELAHEYREVKKQRAKLSTENKELKNGREQELMAEILMWMDAERNSSFRFDDGVTLVKVKSSRGGFIKITDPEKLARWIFNQMKTAQAQGKPLWTAIPFQKSIKKEYLYSHIAKAIGVHEMDLMEMTDEQFNVVSSVMGVRRSTRPGLSMRNNKNQVLEDEDYE